MSVSPIDILDNDTLLSIFDTITAKIPLRNARRIDRPLTIIRVASQVCQRWRVLLLASPWVWGRLIDLGIGYVHNRRKKIEWMEEVARRSGSTAPLWIYGEAGEQLEPSLTFNMEQYFIQRLESWERVEKLSVSIRGCNTTALFDYLRNRFLSPAPILELFDLNFFNTPTHTPTLYLDSLQSGPSKRLFADFAPSLRRIRANKVAYRIDSPWLSNIREIHPFPKHLTLKDIFVILQHTQAIERISISNNHLLWVQPPFPNLRLCNLSCISLSTNLLLGAAILKHITPGILTGFHISVGDLQDEALNQSYILSSFKENFPSYISNYFSANTSTALSLSIRSRYFGLSDITTGPYTDDGSPQNFEVVVGTSYSDEYQHDWDNIVACLLAAFTESTRLQENLSLFGSVTGLLVRDSVEVQPALVPNLVSMLALFRHVKDIYARVIYWDSLSAFFDMASNSDNPQHVLFPQLHTLHLMYDWQGTDIINNSMFVVFTQFMERRKKLGFPVAKLDLTKCREPACADGLFDLTALDGSSRIVALMAALGSPISMNRVSKSPRSLCDLCDLEALDGLEVVWAKNSKTHGEGFEIFSYICGSGEPERLKGLI